MANDLRHKDANWTVPAEVGGTASFEAAQLAVLMDLRDEMKRLNSLLHCTNFVSIPHELKRIRINTTKPKRKRKVKS